MVDTVGRRSMVGLLTGALVLAGCGGASESAATFTGSSTVKAESGMSFDVSVRAGAPEATVTTVTPKESTLTVTMPLTVQVTNATEGFDADVSLSSLDDAVAWLPPIAGVPGSLSDRANGVGPELSASYCGGSTATISPGDSAECTYELEWQQDLPPDVAQAAAAAVPSLKPVAVSVGDRLSLDWASAADANSYDRYADERAMDCGYPFSRYATGQPRCRFEGQWEQSQDLVTAAGGQARPTLTITTVSPEGSTASATYADLDEPVDLALDMIEHLPSECPVAQKDAQTASDNRWMPGTDVVFVVTDGDEAGLAFDAPADLTTVPESVNEELVRTGLWVPSYEFENEDFDPMRKVGPGNLPFAMPSYIPGDWSPLRREYAPRIVELGNVAASAGLGTPTGACAAEIRALLIVEEKRRKEEQRERERNWRKYRGSGGGSFNIPGWLCPTRWC